MGRVALKSKGLPRRLQVSLRHLRHPKRSILTNFRQRRQASPLVRKRNNQRPLSLLRPGLLLLLLRLPPQTEVPLFPLRLQRDQVHLSRGPRIHDPLDLKLHLPHFRKDQLQSRRAETSRVAHAIRQPSQKDQHQRAGPLLPAVGGRPQLPQDDWQPGRGRRGEGNIGLRSGERHGGERAIGTAERAQAGGDQY